MKHLTNIDLAQNELQNAVIQPLASDPASPLEGQVYFNTTTNKFRVFNGSSWEEMGTSSDGTGDMLSSVYDPQAIEADAFARANHTGTQSADSIVDGTTNKAFTATLKTKLDGVEAGADVTDATNVDAAGAVMNTDLSTASMGFVIDEDNMASNSATKVPTQQSVKAYTDAQVAALIDSSPSTLDTLNELAAALGDDPNFATTVTTSIGEKLAKASNLSDVPNAATAFDNIKQGATTSATGVVELATQAETNARTDTGRAVTPASLADFPRKYAANIGDGSATAIDVTHNLGTKDVVAQVRDAVTDEVVECDIKHTSTTVSRFTFNLAPATNAYRVVLVG